MKPIFHKFSMITIMFYSSLLFSMSIFADPPNLTLAKNELKNYHDSGLYEKELTRAITQAQKYIDDQIELNQKEKLPKKLALVLDIDETSLSNYNAIIQRDFGGTREQFHKDIMRANAPAIKPMLSLYNDAVDHGIHVFFVTGRKETERTATEKNLTQSGYNKWAGLYLRPDNYAEKSIIPFKSHTREMIINQGYTIIASIGDQYSDLKGGYAHQVFKLPNPFYYLP